MAVCKTPFYLSGLGFQAECFYKTLGCILRLFNKINVHRMYLLYSKIYIHMAMPQLQSNNDRRSVCVKKKTVARKKGKPHHGL